MQKVDRGEEEREGEEEEEGDGCKRKEGGRQKGRGSITQFMSGSTGPSVQNTVEF